MYFFYYHLIPFIPLLPAITIPLSKENCKTAEALEGPAPADRPSNCLGTFRSGWGCFSQLFTGSLQEPVWKSMNFEDIQMCPHIWLMDWTERRKLRSTSGRMCHSLDISGETGSKKSVSWPASAGQSSASTLGVPWLSGEERPGLRPNQGSWPLRCGKSLPKSWLTTERNIPAAMLREEACGGWGGIGLFVKDSETEGAAIMDR